MPIEIDDGTRHLGEPICAACGGGLEYDGRAPSPEDVVSCDNPECRRSATYAEVAEDCEAWYGDCMDLQMQQMALGRMTSEALGKLEASRKIPVRHENRRCRRGAGFRLMPSSPGELLSGQPEADTCASNWL